MVTYLKLSVVKLCNIIGFFSYLCIADDAYPTLDQEIPNAWQEA